jgi:hypothetical protein
MEKLQLNTTHYKKMANKMNKKGSVGAMVFMIIAFEFGVILYLNYDTTEYTYVGTIIDMEGGSSGKILILELDTIGKTPYTTMSKCSNKIRIGQKVYSKSSYISNSNYLWVKYDEDKYC